MVRSRLISSHSHALPIGIPERFFLIIALTPFATFCFQSVNGLDVRL
jgi:hypothetical protein